MNSNRWEVSQSEREFDRSVRKHDTTMVINKHTDDGQPNKSKVYKDSILEEDDHQMEIQKIVIDKLASTQPEGKLSIHTSVMNNGIRSEVRKASSGIFALKEHSHRDKTPKSGVIKKEVHKGLGSKKFKYEKIEAHEQKLFKDVIMRKKKVKSEKNISDREANLSRLMTISEESERKDEEELHNKTKKNTGVHLKTKDGKNSNRHRETKLTGTKGDRIGDTSINTPEDKYSKQA